MVDKILMWIEQVDWNVVVESVLSYTYLLYYLQIPIILIAGYFFFKSIAVPKFWQRLSLTILLGVGFFIYHKMNIVTLPDGEMNFKTINVVTIEYIAGALIGLLAVFIFIARYIISKIIGLFTRD